MNWVPHVNTSHPRVPNISEKNATDQIIREVCIHCDKSEHFTNQCLNAITLSKPPTHVNTVSPVDRQEQGKDELLF
ncbi:hypothetical protein I7I48_01507 [Histoplasma ohiense]|nr:hypothetical protein I7I48_01507 [Histoplasma ohiense (nom. inval.)]